MNGLIQTALEALTYLLDLHYELVTFLGEGIYSFIITTVYILQSLSLAGRHVYGGVSTLVVDCFQVIIHAGKVLAWVLAWLVIIAKNVLLLLESILYNVSMSIGY